jgi:neutral ceramidase
MTGPAVEINFMGYAVPSQRGSGIHQRLRARAFIMSDNLKSVAFVSVDGGMASDLVKMRVIDYLNKELGESIYTTENLAISGTHTHSGPAGFLQYVLFQMTSLGFVQETFDAWVTGISEAVLMAHRNLKSGSIYVNEGKLYDANINRSPTSYLLNPEEERNQYSDGDTDKNMMLLKFVNAKDSSVMGVLNWFAVHGTSMNNTNTLISGDNRGYASYALEKDINGPSSTAGMGPFVAAFASTNLGDVSPNTAGAKCIDTGLPCDGTSSTCNGRCENCIAFGPGTNGDMFESTRIIGDKQYTFAKSLMSSASETLAGSVDYRHSFVEMPTLNVTVDGGKRTTTLCTPAMGYSFAAGTTDGPGMFDFSQGTTTGNIFWNKVRDFLSKPTNEEIACQHPKPILLNTGDVDVPYAWDPHIVPVQILRLGNLFILAAPSEFTTMAGRRLRKAISDRIAISSLVSSDQTIHVTIAGLANSYSSYVTTYEEYQAQRYEAASTIYGPHTLDGYIQEFTRLIDDMIAGRPSDAGPSPPDLTDEQIQLIPGSPIFDMAPHNHSFGEVVDGYDVQESYAPGDMVTVKFYAANPRNNQHVSITFRFICIMISNSSNHPARTIL